MGIKTDLQVNEKDIRTSQAFYGNCPHCNREVKIPICSEFWNYESVTERVTTELKYYATKYFKLKLKFNKLLRAINTIKGML